MSTDEFTKLFTYMSQRFDNIDKSLDTKASSEQLQNIMGMLDAMSKRLEISDDERLVMAHQLTKIHDWVEQAAERIDLKFAH